MATAALTGTFVPTGRSAGVVAGGKTVIVTLTGSTWVAAGATFDAQRQNIIDGMVSAQSEATGWNAEVKAKLPVTDVVRTSSTVVTVTMSAQAAYAITAVETVTVTVPGTAVVDATSPVATPTIGVAPAVWPFYVSPDGNDSNNGLGPDASHATNKPWLTLTKAVNSGTPVEPGDTVWVAPGLNFNNGGATPVSTASSAGSPTTVRGDPTNSRGFKDGSGVLRAPAASWVLRRASSIDADPSNISVLITMSNGSNGWTWRDLVLENAATGTSMVVRGHFTATDWSFQDCRFIGSATVVFVLDGTPTAGMNLTIRRCIVIGYDIARFDTTTAAATADADLNVLVEGCLGIGAALGITNRIGSGGGNLGGGITYRGNTMLCGAVTNALATTADRISLVAPMRVEGNVVISQRFVSAGTTGQVVDDGYNRTLAINANTNFTAAGTSIAQAAWPLVLPDLVKWGLELPRADWFGWTDQAVSTQIDSAWSNTNADFLGRTVRPWGAGTSIGYVEAPTVTKDTASAITGGGANSLKMTAAGEVSFYLPVEASSTTISVKTKSDSYGGTSYPQLIVQPNPTVAVAGATVTATDATEQTLTTGAFTPTAQGVVEVRLVSRSSATNSSTWFDLLTVTP
jgi:hypothetical protein